MKILVLNCGSSSVKYQLFDMKKDRAVAKGIVERLGKKDAISRYTRNDEAEIKEILPVKDHTEAIGLGMKYLTDKENGVIESKEQINAVGHRVVHGGERFSGSVLINDEIIACIRDFCRFAPLHNPANLKGIEASNTLLPGVPQVAVFDTAFHQHIPNYAYIYGLPIRLYHKLGIRRYGFHGTSHWYVAKQAAKKLGEPLEDLKIITCHLGNGVSITAVKDGHSVDTSMGFTPLEGVVMGTRCGDIDPALVPYIMTTEGLSTSDVDKLMNKESGLLGLSERGSDMREILSGMREGDEKCALAFKVFCYRIKKYIGAYAAALGGLDAVVFTGGIGENSGVVRKEICSGLEFMGINIDDKKNDKNDVSVGKGGVHVLVIPTNEELAIARDTIAVLKGKS